MNNNNTTYKDSPLGKIPVDWEVKTISEAFEICNNLRFPISEEEREKIKGIYPYYGPTKIQDYINEYRLEGTYALIGEDGDHFLKWKELPMTLLVNGRFNVNNHAHIILGTENLTEWVFYYFNHRELTPHLTRQGAGRYKLSKGSLSKILCPLPPLSEQKAIAHLLGLMDSAINTNNQLIAKKELQKKWLMQKLLSEKLIVKNEKWWKSGFRKVTVGEIAIVKKGKPIIEKDIKEGNIPVIAGGKTSPYSHDKYTDERVITISASGAYAGFVSFHENKIWASDCSVLKEIKEELNIYYLFYHLIYNQEKIYKLQRGGAQPHVFPKDIFHYSLFIINSVKEQTAIAEVLQAADSEIQLLKTKTKKLMEQKKGLMQVLLTGKKRLIINK